MSLRSCATSPRPHFTLPRMALLMLAMAVLATGCSSLRKKNEAPRTVEQIYQDGHTAMTRNNWSGGEKQFKQLIAQYPYGPYTEQALMEMAYAQYKAGNEEDAVSTVDRFLRTYPTQRHVPYMYYLRGLANSSRDTVFLQKVWRLDASRRDLSTPMQAYSDFNTVSERYPNSRYAADARQRMVYLRNQFARHEMDVALYYLRRGAYVSVVERAQHILETYPQSEYQYDAVAALAEAYTHLGNKTLADDARRVLQLNDPQHPWLAGNWPHYPHSWRKLNPFAGEKSPLDNEDKN
ncbi:MAG: outer membrane protein assembly factor BamD [Pseudoxanthomonas sp.]